MKRIVVDTNVLVSAIVFGGKPAQVMWVVEQLGIQIATSLELEEELQTTLHRKFGWEPARIQQATSRIWAGAYWVTPDDLSGVVRDADDHVVLATALASEAAFIVTGDRDLLVLNEFQGIRIIQPAAFLDLLAPPH